MTIDEAKKIFNVWKEYIEIAEKLRTLFVVVPEAFLPYAADTLEEALNIVAKDFFDSGNKRMANNIQETMCLHLIPYYIPSGGNARLTDEEVLKLMKKNLDLILENPKLMDATIQSLKRSQHSWIQSRTK
jgi:hypothetical protein